MKVLSIDTASDICGVSILENDTILYKLDINTGHTHSESLMPTISQAFDISNISLKDIELIVCDIGPGSFTGIRIGVATTKAFSDSLNIPCVGISSLEALAYKTKVLDFSTKTICSIIDCKNDNCYFAIFTLKDGSLSCQLEPTASTVKNMLEIVKTYNAPFFIGDGVLTYKNIIKNTISDCSFADDNNLDSYYLAIAGIEKYLQFGETSILPLYLKKPQAERQFEEKSKKI